MKYETLGNTELKVSKICLGSMSWGEQNTEQEAHEQLNYAIEQGVNFIDTAELYAVPGREETQGLTEQYIGTWLANRTDRHKLIIATKIVGPSSGLLYIRNPLNFSAESITAAIESSLKRLQTDYVDLYQLHWPERKTNFFGQRGYKVNDECVWEDNIEDVLRSLKKLVDQGKVRYIGLSNETPWGLMSFLRAAERHGLPRVVSVQNPYSLVGRLYEVGMAEMSIRENCGLLAYSPMAFGLLSNKYFDGSDVSNSRIALYQQMARYNGENTRRAAQEYYNIAQNAGLSLATMSLAYVNSRPFVTSNIIGGTKLEHIKENIDSVEVELSEEVLNAIEEVQERIPNPAP